MKRTFLAVVIVVVGASAASGCAAPDDDLDLLPGKPGLKADSGNPTSDTGGGKETEPVDTGTEEDTAPPEEDTAPEDTGRVDDTGVIDDGGDPCTTCINTACSKEISACLGDTNCNKQMDCLSKCADPTCADKCSIDYPSTKFDDLMMCISTKCSTPCGGP